MVESNHWPTALAKADLNFKKHGKENNRVKVTSDIELKDRLVAINRTTKVTKGGRTFTFAAIVVVGDGNGVIGYGLGKANEVTTAIAKGVEVAKKTSSRFLYTRAQFLTNKLQSSVAAALS